MANMNFGVNILPKANNTYSLGNSDYKWNIFANTINGTSVSTLLDNIITDIKIGETSILSNGVATIPYATSSTPGLTFAGGMGISLSYGHELYIAKASESQIKAGTSQYMPIVPYNQDASVFYGLAKAAGDSTQSASSNVVGLYTDDAKFAIKNMLGITPMTGATSSTAGASGLVPAPATTDVDKFLAGDGTYKSGGLPMVVLSYGNSTWADFEAAYNNNVIVYCRASSNSNPATGSQTRMAFMAYVDNSTTPTNVEFQYYRSVNPSNKSMNQLSDQVFVYKLDKTSGWSVTTREASIKSIVFDASTGLTGTYNYSTGVLTITTAT